MTKINELNLFYAEVENSDEIINLAETILGSEDTWGKLAEPLLIAYLLRGSKLGKKLEEIREEILDFDVRFQLNKNECLLSIVSEFALYPEALEWLAIFLKNIPEPQMRFVASITCTINSAIVNLFKEDEGTVDYRIVRVETLGNKTTSLVLPQIISLSGSDILVSNPKGKISPSTIESLRKEGHKIILLSNED